ncbi:uncharacterized protein [Rutidosis leptorrhynchoides]|uniref:uncharacterized protein n=1 Tax=Rutidosis leptorrhynchoides TaxID=125765 RepID=UPI003A9A43C8
MPLPSSSTLHESFYDFQFIFLTATAGKNLGCGYLTIWVQKLTMMPLVKHPLQWHIVLMEQEFVVPFIFETPPVVAICTMILFGLQVAKMVGHSAALLNATAINCIGTLAVPKEWADVMDNIFVFIAKKTEYNVLKTSIPTLLTSETSMRSLLYGA